MRIVVCAGNGQEWVSQLTALGHTVTRHPIGTLIAPTAADVCWVVTPTVAGLAAQRFWLMSITIPLVVITPVLDQAQTLCRSVAALHLICHPQRATDDLANILLMARDIHAGIVLLASGSTHMGDTYGA